MASGVVVVLIVHWRSSRVCAVSLRSWISISRSHERGPVMASAPLIVLPAVNSAFTLPKFRSVTAVIRSAPIDGGWSIQPPCPR